MSYSPCGTELRCFLGADLQRLRRPVNSPSGLLMPLFSGLPIRHHHSIKVDGAGQNDRRCPVDIGKIYQRLLSKCLLKASHYGFVAPECLRWPTFWNLEGALHDIRNRWMLGKLERPLTASVGATTIGLLTAPSGGGEQPSVLRARPTAATMVCIAAANSNYGNQSLSDS